VPLLSAQGYRVIDPNARSAITVPMVAIASDFDGPTKDGAVYRQLLTGTYSHRVLDGIGHNVPQEAPQEFADAIIDADGLGSQRPRSTDTRWGNGRPALSRMVSRVAIVTIAAAMT
jgi:hypothetical protein